MGKEGGGLEQKGVNQGLGILATSAEDSSSWKASSSSACHEIPSTLLKPMVHCGIQRQCHLPLSDVGAFQSTPPSYFFRIRLNLSFHPRLLYQAVSFLQASKPYPPLLFPILACRPAHFNIFNLFTAVFSGKQYKSRHFSRDFLHSTITSHLFECCTTSCIICGLFNDAVGNSTLYRMTG